MKKILLTALLVLMPIISIAERTIYYNRIVLKNESDNSVVSITPTNNTISVVSDENPDIDLYGGANIWPNATTNAGPEWVIDYSNLLQHVHLTGIITNITFQALTNTQTRFVEMWIEGATNVTYSPAGVWVREPSWTNDNAHVVFSWSLGTVSASMDKEAP